ncbi:MAG: FxsA family protein [Halopseudomonas sabulinigri]|tara:strand:+ start:33126 stop:33575 length:450 start_codon:yes stop_codon:yes gene_type:complete
MPLFRLLMLVFPLLELASLIVLGDRIGVGATLFWVLGTGVLGLLLIQRQGFSMLQQLQLKMAENRSPFAVLKTGMWWLLAGVLLMIPGLITDALAVPCLVMALLNKGRPAPGEPGGPGVYKRGGNTIIEGEWKPGDEKSVEPEERIDQR